MFDKPAFIIAYHAQEVLFMDLGATATHLLLLIGLILFRWLVHKEDPRSFKISIDRKGWVCFVNGALTGLIYIFSYVIIILLSGHARLSLAFTWPCIQSTIALGVKAFILFLPEVLFKEGLFRGYLFVKLSEKPKTLPKAVAVTSLAYVAYSLILHKPPSYAVTYGVNTFILSLILCLMVYSSNSLMGVIGKELAFEIAQHLLFAQNTVDNLNPTVLILHLDASPLTGIAGNIETGLAFSLVLVLGLIYEIWHVKSHLGHLRPEN